MTNFALPSGQRSDNFICFWRGHPLLLFLSSSLWPRGKHAAFLFLLGLGTQVFWDPKFSPQGFLAIWPKCRCFSGTNGPFSGSLFAAVGFSLVAFSNSVYVPAMFPTISRLNGTWHLPLLVTSVLWIELPWKLCLIPQVKTCSPLLVSSVVKPLNVPN